MLQPLKNLIQIVVTNPVPDVTNPVPVVTNLVRIVVTNTVPDVTNPVLVVTNPVPVVTNQISFVVSNGVQVATGMPVTPCVWSVGWGGTSRIRDSPVVMSAHRDTIVR